MTKPNKDGWIRHRGGKCPVEKGALIDVRHRDGDVFEAVSAGEYPAHDENWLHNTDYKDRGEIMAWRPHKPDRGEVVSSLQDECATVVELANSLADEGPIQWRDRIREIDAASKEEEARHCAAMDAYDSERASLIAKLKAEGFALIQGDEPNSAADSAHQDIAQQDMSDWRNWQKGDVVECVSHNNEWSRKFKIGERGIVKDLNTDATKLFVNIDGWNVTPSDFKWHSRPTN